MKNLLTRIISKKGDKIIVYDPTIEKICQAITDLAGRFQINFKDELQMNRIHWLNEAVMNKDLERVLFYKQQLHGLKKIFVNDMPEIMAMEICVEKYGE